VPPKTKVNSLTVRYLQSVRNEFLSWAKLSLEAKFVIALFLLIFAVTISGFAPILSSVFNIWGVIIFFEAILQKNFRWERWNGPHLLKTYLIAGILGTLLGSFLLLYLDLVYYLKLSLFDFLTRYIWFLLPLSRIISRLKNLLGRKIKNKRGS